MSRLRDVASEAVKKRRSDEAAARAAATVATATAAVKRAASSPLGIWFPQVTWEFVATLADGTTLVREKDGLDTLLGVKVTKDGAPNQGPDEWEVAVYQMEPGFILAPNGYRRVEVLKDAADLGDFLERTTPKLASSSEPSA